MWTRAELKRKAKVALKRNYICCILAALVLLFAMGSQERTTVSVSKEAGSNYWGETEGYIGMDGEMTLDEMYLQTEALMNSPAMAVMESFLLGPMQMIWDFLTRLFGWIPFLFFALKILVFGPIEVGGCRFFMKNSSETVQLKELFFVFQSKDYWNIVRVMFLRDLYVVLWGMLFFIPGVIKSYEYRMIPYLLAEEPGMNRMEVFARSREMMYGQKWKTFVLDFSFILWEYLSVMTFGLVGILFVNPYMHATNAELYYALEQRVEME